MKSAEGTLIALAAGPGETSQDDQTGTHSAFTSALVANIAAPGVEIQQAMTLVRAQVSKETHSQQLPWGQTSLTGAVYLNPTRTGFRDSRHERADAGRARRSWHRKPNLNFGARSGRPTSSRS
jgi:hypothetical protein